MLKKLQSLGQNLSDMVMPNIPCFIAWGLLAAFFIPTGWTPNEKIGRLVRPMMMYMLPLIMAYSGGHMVYSHRGGVLGVIMAMGAIVSSDINMFLGAMITGPLAAYIIKKSDEVIMRRIPKSIEVLVSNFSAGIIGGVLAILSLLAVGPVIEQMNIVLSRGVGALVENNLLPFASVIIEPAKIFFLNNAINYGILSPVAMIEAAEIGKSIYFTIEPNPGPGLGVLLAYSFFGSGKEKSLAPGAVIIEFFGGIHEIYFPYVLMKPILILPLIFSGMSGVITTMTLHGGLVSIPSPGSVFAWIAVSPKSSLLASMTSIFVSALVSFTLSSLILILGLRKKKKLE